MNVSRSDHNYCSVGEDNLEHMYIFFVCEIRNQCNLGAELIVIFTNIEGLLYEVNFQILVLHVVIVLGSIEQML